MAKTVVGMMDDIDEAQAVVREAVDAGIRREDIGFTASEQQAVPSTAHLNEGEGGDHGEEAYYYAGGVRRGGILVTVAADDQASAERAVAIMQRHGAIDIARN